MTVISSCLGLTCEVAHASFPDTLAQLHDDIGRARQLGKRFIPLGDTSNVVLPSKLDAWICFYQSQAMAIEQIDDYTVILKIDSGQDWHSLVQHCSAQGWWGIENLAAIPGKVGAAPIQNIGAYGVELADVFVSCDAINCQTSEVKTFTKDDCQFGYRDSIFKHSTDQWVIVSVTLALSRQRQPKLGYGQLAQVIDEHATASDIVEKISQIRWAKLPNPAELPNTGSFFHNPVVSASMHDQLTSQFPGLVSYPLADGQFKLAAGWLIDQAGLKGLASDGGVRMHKNQALVLTNPNRASRAQVLEHARYVQSIVLERYGVRLHIEPVVL